MAAGGAVYMALAVAVTGLALLTVWRPAAVAVLPQGVGNSWRGKVIRWEDIPGPVSPSGTWRGTATLTLAVGKVISGLWLTAEPWYLARVIEYYRVHPEHRSAIGTREEPARLKTALPEWFEAYQRSWR